MAPNIPPKDAPSTAPKPPANEPRKIVTRSFAPDNANKTTATPAKPNTTPKTGKELATKPVPAGQPAKEDPFGDATFKSKRFASNAPYDSTVKKLQELETLDQLCEAKLKRSLILLILSIVAAIISAIVLGSIKVTTVYFIIFELPFIAFFIYALLTYLHFRKLDLSNEFRTFLMPVLKSLRNDLRKESTVNLNVDLAKLDAKQYLTKKSPAYDSGNKKRCVDSIYERQLLKLALRLEDKNTLVVNCSEKLTKTSFRKSSGGKIKFKNKVKQNVDFDLRLLVNKDAYAVAPLPEKSEVLVKTHPKGTMLCVKYKEKFKTPDVQPNTELFLEKLIELYSYLGPQKKTA